MQVGASKGKKHKYLYYRCDNKECSVKSIRAKHIFDPLYEILDRFKFTEAEYQEYKKHIGEISKKRVETLRTERKSLQGELNALKRKISVLNNQYIELDANAPKTVRDTLANKIDEADIRIEKIESRISDINNILVNADKIHLSKEEFLNTLKTLSQ